MRRADRDIRTDRFRPHPEHWAQPQPAVPPGVGVANPEPVPYPEQLQRPSAVWNWFARFKSSLFRALSGGARVLRQPVLQGLNRIRARIVNRSRQWTANAKPGPKPRIGPFRVVEVATIVAIAALAAMLIVLITFPGDDDAETVTAAFPPSGIPDSTSTVRSVQTSTITLARPRDDSEPIVVETFKLPDARIASRCGLALSPVEHPEDYLFFNAAGPEDTPRRALMILDGEAVDLIRLNADGPLLHHGQHALQSFGNQGGAVRVSLEIEFGAEDAGIVPVSQGVLRIVMPGRNRVTAIPVAGYAGCTAEAHAGSN